MMLASTHVLDAKPSWIRSSRRRVQGPQACLRCAQQQLLQGVRMHSTAPLAPGAQCSTSERGLTPTFGLSPMPLGQAISACAADRRDGTSSHAIEGGHMHAALPEPHSGQQAARSDHQHNPGDPAPAASAGRQESTSENLSTSSPDQAPTSAPTQPEASEHDSLGVRMALSALRFYKQGISPLMPSVCRFLPTCSQYSVDAYKSYGVARGTVLTAWRLLRCNPWGGRGYDPVKWPPPGLPAAVFEVDGSAEVAVVVGVAAFVWLVQSALFG